jgi:hypothetical protein
MLAGVGGGSDLLQRELGESILGVFPKRLSVGQRRALRKPVRQVIQLVADLGGETDR